MIVPADNTAIKKKQSTIIKPDVKLTTYEHQIVRMKEEMKKREETADQRFQLLGSTINNLIHSSDKRLSQIQIVSQIQTQVCMLGI